MLIADPHDPRLDDIRDLNKSDKSGEGLVIAEGHLVVSRLVSSCFPVRCIVGFANALKHYVETYGEPGCPMYEVDRATLAEVVGFDMHRGLVAAADRVAPLEVSEAISDAKTVVVLEGVGDHENIGSLFRNAAGMDVDAVLLGAGAADPLYRRSVRIDGPCPTLAFCAIRRRIYHVAAQLRLAGRCRFPLGVANPRQRSCASRRGTGRS